MFSYIPPNGTSKYGMYFQRTKTKIVLKNKTLLVISSDNQKKKKKKTKLAIQNILTSLSTVE